MKISSTLLLLVIAAALYGFIHFYAAKKPGTKEQMEQERFITSFDRDDVDGITIRLGEEIKAKLALKEGNWFMEKPVKDRADENLVARIFTTLERIEKQQEILPGKNADGRSNHSEFGLSNPKMRVDFTGKNPPPAILIGRETAVENRIYLALEGSDTAYVTDIAVRDVINIPSDDFRDHQLGDIPATQVRRVVIGMEEGQMELEQDGEYWNILRPIKARADTSRVADLIRGATTVRIKKFLGADSGDLSAYGLSEPRCKVSLFTDKPDEILVFELGSATDGKESEDGGEPEQDGVYVRHAGRNSVVLLPKEVENFLTTTPTDLRDKKLTRINLDVVDRVTLQLAGASPIVLARDKEEWVFAGESKAKANARKIMDLLNDLRNTEVKSFVADTSSDLAAHGLDDPQLRIVISSYSSENVPEHGAGEHPILNIAFGKTEEDAVFARLEEEPFIVSVNKSLLENISVDPMLWRALPVFTYDLEDVTSITRTVGEHTTELVRTGDNTWESEGAKINQTGAASLSNTLARLRAVRWLGEVKAEHGFDKPSVTIEFKTEAASHTLKVGAELEGMFCATIGDGAFLINRPDYEALIGQVKEAEDSNAP